MEQIKQPILLVFGQNWENYHHKVIRRKHGSEKRLSIHSIRTTQAADALLDTGEYSAAIITTGHTNGPSQPAEADAMGDLLTVMRKDKPEIPLHRETESFDTPSNIHKSLDLMAELGLKGPIDVVAPYYHLPRIKLTAQGLGMDIREAFPTEKVLDIKRAPTPVWEYVLRPLAKLDPEGTIPRRVWTERRTR